MLRFAKKRIKKLLRKFKAEDKHEVPALTHTAQGTEDDSASQGARVAVGAGGSHDQPGTEAHGVMPQPWRSAEQGVACHAADHLLAHPQQTAFDLMASIPVNADSLRTRSGPSATPQSTLQRGGSKAGRGLPSTAALTNMVSTPEMSQVGWSHVPARPHRGNTYGDARLREALAGHHAEIVPLHEHLLFHSHEGHHLTPSRSRSNPQQGSPSHPYHASPLNPFNTHHIAHRHHTHRRHQSRSSAHTITHSSDHHRHSHHSDHHGRHWLMGSVGGRRVASVRARKVRVRLSPRHSPHRTATLHLLMSAEASNCSQYSIRSAPPQGIVDLGFWPQRAFSQAMASADGPRSSARQPPHRASSLLSTLSVLKPGLTIDTLSPDSWTLKSDDPFMWWTTHMAYDPPPSPPRAPPSPHARGLPPLPPSHHLQGGGRRMMLAWSSVSTGGMHSAGSASTPAAAATSSVGGGAGRGGVRGSGAHGPYPPSHQQSWRLASTEESLEWSEPQDHQQAAAALAAYEASRAAQGLHSRGSRGSCNGLSAHGSWRRGSSTLINSNSSPHPPGASLSSRPSAGGSVTWFMASESGSKSHGSLSGSQVAYLATGEPASDPVMMRGGSMRMTGGSMGSSGWTGSYRSGEAAPGEAPHGPLLGYRESDLGGPPSFAHPPVVSSGNVGLDALPDFQDSQATVEGGSGGGPMPGSALAQYTEDPESEFEDRVLTTAQSHDPAALLDSWEMGQRLSSWHRLGLLPPEGQLWGPHMGTMPTIASSASMHFPSGGLCDTETLAALAALGAEDHGDTL